MKSLRECLKQTSDSKQFENKLEFLGDEDAELKSAVCDALEPIADKFIRKYHIDKEDMENALEWFIITYWG